MRQRLLRQALGHWVDPEAAFLALYRDATDVVWLDSGPGATAGFSYVGAASRVVVAGDKTPGRRLEGSIFEFLRREIDVQGWSGAEASPDGGFALGWVGWFGYELRGSTMGHGITQAPRESRYPDAAFVYLDRAIEFDHARREVSLLCLADEVDDLQQPGDAWAGERADWRDSIVDALRASDAATGPRGAVPALVEDRVGLWHDSDERYLAMIEGCLAAIRNGDAYQLCLTTEVEVPGAADAVDTYRRLRAASPSHHGALLRIGGVALLSSSPESFLTISPSRVIESRPIKGTRPRGASYSQDDALRQELRENDKERAENLMIVDLMRNDIGRVSDVGTVEVTGLLEVESYAQVHQLVSTVRGRLAPGFDPIDAIVACFPAGSMTGAPKWSAVGVLDGLEGRARGVYSGAFGYLGLDGRVDLAVVIRSILIDADGATVGSGGGITALSQPLEELAEVKLKAAALLAALGVTQADASGRPQRARRSP